MIDYVKQWFEIYRELGENTDITLKIEKAQSESYMHFPHENGDGSSALFAWAKEKKIHIKNLAEDRFFAPPHPILYFIRCLQFIKLTGPQYNLHWPIETFKDHASSHSESGTRSFSWNEAGSWGLTEKNFNATLMLAADRTTRDFFKIEQAVLRWWMPVNMRNELGHKLNADMPAFNFVSNFTLFTDSQDSLKSLHEKIVNSLKQKKHWATWWWQMLGRYLPRPVIKALARNNLAKIRYAGVFTNLGAWSCEDQDTNLFLIVNTLRSHPIGTSVIRWNDHVNLAVRFHPSVMVHPEQVQKFLMLWQKEIKNVLESSRA